MACRVRVSMLAIVGVTAQDVFLSKEQKIQDYHDTTARCEHGQCDGGSDYCIVFESGSLGLHCRVNDCPQYAKCWRHQPNNQLYWAEPPRNLCTYGVCDYNVKNNNCVWYDEGKIHCAVTQCPSDESCWTHEPSHQVYYKEYPLKPTSLRTCLDLIYGVEGGSAGFIDKKITKKVGSSSSSTISKTKKKEISTKVSVDVSANEIFEKMDVNTETAHAFENTATSTFEQSENEETTYAFEIHIDLSKPAWYYRAITTIETYNHEVINLYGDSQVVMNHEVSDGDLCGEFDLLR